MREVASRKVVVTLPVSAETLSFAPHANLLASGNSSGVKLWDTETWREARSLPDTMLPSLFSPDGRWLVTGVAGSLRVWDTQTWQPVGDCPGEPRLASRAWNAVAVSPDGQFLLTVAGEDEAGDHLRVWRLPSMERLPDVRIENQQPFSAAFSADGKHILVGLLERTARRGGFCDAAGEANVERTLRPGYGDCGRYQWSNLRHQQCGSDSQSVGCHYSNISRGCADT